MAKGKGGGEDEGGGEGKGGSKGKGGGKGWSLWVRRSCRCFHSVISFLSGKEMP